MPRRILPLIALLLALSPAVAGAVTVTDDGVTTHIDGGPEDNTATIEPGMAGTVLVTDTAGVTAGAGCTGTGSNSATCGTGNTITITAALGDGTNSLKGVGSETSWGMVFGINATGGAGADTLGPDPRLGAPWDIAGGGGNDVLSGSPDADLIHGGDGDDEIHGGAGADLLYGDAGKDTIYGDDGDDIMNTQDGEADTLNCGLGQDEGVVDSLDTAQANGQCEFLNDSGTVTTEEKKAKVPTATSYGRHAKARAGKTYKGTTLTAVVKHGRVHFDAKRIHVECEFTESNFDLKHRKGSAKLRKGAIFADTSEYDVQNDGLVGKVSVGGAFDGRKAHGYIVLNAAINTENECTSGVIRWKATT